MCKFTIFNLECGHPAEDRVETRDCPYYQKIEVPCDRDNPANRDRTTIRFEDRNGLCRNCRRRQQEKNELDAMQREMEKARELSRAEALERERAAQEHEDRIIRESVKEYERQLREREREDMKAVLKATKEAEEKRREKEDNDLARGLAASRIQLPAVRNIELDEKFTRGQKEVDGGTLEGIRTEKTPTINVTKHKPLTQAPAPPPPPPPPPPPAAVQIPSPPPPIKAAPRLRPSPVKQEAKQVGLSLPPIGPQDYGHHFIGTRRQPIHESQKLQEPTPPKSPIMPNAPAPFARLGSTVKPADTPSFHQVQGPGFQLPAGDARAGLRSAGGRRPTVFPVIEPEEGAELWARLEERRKWENDDDATSNGSITPSESVSNVGTQVDRTTTTTSDMSRADTLTATLPLRPDLDEKRKKGWRKD